MSRMTAAERELAVALANEACGEAARAHTVERAHTTVLVSGTGWACETCDPDLFPQMHEQAMERWEPDARWVGMDEGEGSG